MDLEEILRGLGVASVRSAHTVAQAIAAIAQRTPDFALLDVSLGSQTSLNVARRLRELGVRFAFVTGHGDTLSVGEEFSNWETIRKPYTTEMLRDALGTSPEDAGPR